MLSYILPPLIAGLIGYGTNDLAIRMLFRPHKAKYLWGHKLPFTPGLIPREKERIAEALGQSIGHNLMSPEVMQATLLAPDMLAQVEDAVDKQLTKMMSDERPLSEWLAQFVNAEALKETQQRIAADLSGQVTKKLASSELGKQIAHLAVAHALEKMRGGLTGLMRLDKFLIMLQDPAEQMLSKNIDEMLVANAPEMASKMVGEGIDEVMATPVAALLDDKQDQLVAIRCAIVDVYRNTVEQQLPSMLTALDIPAIIQKRINDMDVAEFEKLIMELVDKELKAIVWVGAALGTLIGCLGLMI